MVRLKQLSKNCRTTIPLWAQQVCANLETTKNTLYSAKTRKIKPQEKTGLQLW
jgi:hypothetical protein